MTRDCRIDRNRTVLKPCVFPPSAALTSHPVVTGQLLIIGDGNTITWIHKETGSDLRFKVIAYFRGVALPTLQGDGTFNLELTHGEQAKLQLIDKDKNQIEWSGTMDRLPGDFPPRAGASITGNWVVIRNDPSK